MNESVRRPGPSAHVGEISIRDLTAEIDRRWADANRGSKAWSAAFHLTFGLATVAGVFVAAISGRQVKLFGVDLDNYIPIIAMIGSICSAIGIFGGFERKWKANRTTRNRLDILGLRLSVGDHIDDIVDELIDILRTHDAAILKGDDPAKPLPRGPSGRMGPGGRVANDPRLPIGSGSVPECHGTQVVEQMKTD